MTPAARPLRLFLGGDIMLGRGIDQILATPSDPRLFEAWVTDARDYVRLAESRSGPIPRQVPDTYVWGDLLDDLETLGPDLRIVNLETAVTRSPMAERKGINYRMHPDNAGVLAAAGLDACILANNHVMDWGRDGLLESIETLRGRGIRVAGAGASGREAWAPAVLDAGGGRRLLLLACASADSGVPQHWAAGPERPGIALLPDPPLAGIDAAGSALEGLRRPGDALLVSIHWGGNWGYEVPRWQRDLARAFVDTCGADVVFGHSSHHAKAAEFHAGRLILYGPGDLLNDYEGIGGHENYLTDVALACFVGLDPAGESAVTCRLRPYTIRRFRLERAGSDTAARLAEVMARECGRMDTAVTRLPDGDLLIGGS